jgi:hypothetical protein
MRAIPLRLTEDGMNHAVRIRRRIHEDRVVARDRGVTFVELLVAIVLLGTAVVGILAAVRATVLASHADGERAKGASLLQAASDAVHGEPRVSCAVPDGVPVDAADSPSDWIDNKAAVRAAYEAALATVATGDWPGATLSITSIEYLGAAGGSAFEWSDSHCYEGVQQIGAAVEDFRLSPLPSQKVTIEVTAPDGAVVESIQLVKGSGG